LDLILHFHTFKFIDNPRWICSEHGSLLDLLPSSLPSLLDSILDLQVHRFLTLDLIQFQSWTWRFIISANLSFSPKFISVTIRLDLTPSVRQVHRYLSVDLILFPSHSSRFTNSADLIFYFKFISFAIWIDLIHSYLQIHIPYWT